MASDWRRRHTDLGRGWPPAAQKAWGTKGRISGHNMAKEGGKMAQGGWRCIFRPYLARGGRIRRCVAAWRRPRGQSSSMVEHAHGRDAGSGLCSPGLGAQATATATADARDVAPLRQQACHAIGPRHLRYSTLCCVDLPSTPHRWSSIPYLGRPTQIHQT